MFFSITPDAFISRKRARAVVAEQAFSPAIAASNALWFVGAGNTFSASSLSIFSLPAFFFSLRSVVGSEHSTCIWHMVS